MKNFVFQKLEFHVASRGGINQRKSTKKDTMASINLHNVYAVSPLYNRWNWVLDNNDGQVNISTSSDSQLSGFQLHTYERMDENILQEILIIFQSNEPNQIEQWYQLLSKIILECMNIFFPRIFLFSEFI